MEPIERGDLRSLSDVGLGGDGNTVEGYVIVYDSWSQPLPGGFKEIIRGGAATEFLRSTPNIPALYEHAPTNYLAHTRNNTLKLSEDSKGVRYQIDLPDTMLGRDMRSLAKRGDLGASFYIKVPLGGDKWGKADGMRTREVMKVGMGEVTLTTNPAYADTTAALRSLHEWEKLEAEAKHQGIPLDWLLMKQLLAEW